MNFRFVNVAVAVNDISEAVKKFVDTFGWELDGEVRKEPGLKLEVAVIKAGDVRIELLCPLPGETVLRRFLDTHGEGLYRLAFGVEDMDRLLGRLDNAKVKYVDLSGQVERQSSNRLVFTSPKAASGVMMEFIEGHEATTDQS